MSLLLFISTLVLDFAGVVFAVTYIWLNSFSGVSDLAPRNAGILRITRTSVVLSLIFALLSCLLTSADTAETAIARAALLYAIIAVSWLVVLLGCAIAMFAAFVSKASFREGLSKSMRKIFAVAVTGAIFGMILAWLLG